VGIVGNRKSAADWDADFILAKSAGIDAFALNIGTDQLNDEQLPFAYESAAKNGMKVFLSFDYNHWPGGSDQAVGEMVATYGVKEAQLKIGDKIFVSSFVGVGLLDVAAMRAASGLDLYVVPNFYEGYDDVDGAFNWAGWPSDGENNPPQNGKYVSVHDQDTTYIGALGDKAYMARMFSVSRYFIYYLCIALLAASPWFSTHFGADEASKNWIFPSELLWFQRWLDILALKPAYVEITTWNDFGESHYVGPLSSKHYDDGSSKWANDMYVFICWEVQSRSVD